MSMKKISRLKRSLVKLESALEISQNTEADNAFIKLDTDIKQATNTLSASSTAEEVQNNLSTILGDLQTVLNLQEPDGTPTLTAFKEFGDLQVQMQTANNELQAFFDKISTSPNKAKRMVGDIIYKLDDLELTVTIFNKVHETYKASPGFNQ